MKKSLVKTWNCPSEKKIKDKSYMKTIKNVITGFSDRFTVNADSYASLVAKFSEY